MAGECGNCTACCRVYAIPELSKPAGKWCNHCSVGQGCKIYDARPMTCAEFSCLWLQSRQRGTPLPDELRPDRCKVVFSPSTNPNIMAAITMPGAEGAWRRPAVRKVINRMLSAGMKVVAGPPMALRKTMLDKSGEHEVELTPPDANGMQWGSS